MLSLFYSEFLLQSLYYMFLPSIKNVLLKQFIHSLRAECSIRVRMVALLEYINLFERLKRKMPGILVLIIMLKTIPA